MDADLLAALLAALLDGRLDEAGRRAAIRELAGLCHEDLGVFARATKALRKLEEQDRPMAPSKEPRSSDTV